MRFAFGEHRIDVERREFLRDGAPAALEPQVFDLLVHLLRHRDRVIGKDELIASVWAGRTVSDATIDSRIKAVRQAIGDTGAAQGLIRTFPRKGVRFIGAVEEEYGLPSAPGEQVRASLPIPDKPSVAVLPFANLSGDSDQDYFADGMVEDLITNLSRLRWLFVIARNSTFTYKGQMDIRQVGRELGVRYVVEGSVRRAGNRIRVSAQLIEAESGCHAWAERYDRDLADIFALQDEIAEAVTTAIAPAIADAEQQRAMRKPPGSVDAWAAYQRGLWHLGKFNADDDALAEDFFQRAVDLDPTFAGGYKGLSAVQNSAADFQRRGLGDALSAAEMLARKAVALDAADAEAHSHLANALYRLGDYEGGLAAIEPALALSPNLADAHGVMGANLIFCGRPAKGVEALDRAVRLDPRGPRTATRLNQIALGLYFSREYEAAVEAANRTIRLYPDYPNTYRWRTAALGQLGRLEEASQALAKAIALLPGSFHMYVRTRVPWLRPQDHEHMLDGLRKAGWDG